MKNFLASFFDVARLVFSSTFLCSIIPSPVCRAFQAVWSVPFRSLLRLLGCFFARSLRILPVSVGTSAFLITLFVHPCSVAIARDYVHVVGSSTMMPFITVVAEEFGRINRIRTPVIESTGSGAGIKLFCSGVGEGYPDIATSSRPMVSSEIDLCARNGITGAIEIKMGYDGIVIASSVDSDDFALTNIDLFRALAMQVSISGYSLAKNPFRTWASIHPMLPDVLIEVYGPLRNSGTYQSFVNLIFLGNCMADKAFQNSSKDLSELQSLCSLVRDDGHFIEVGYDENIIVQKITSKKGTLGIFGFNFFDRNRNKVKVTSINGIFPSIETIQNGSYILSRPLYIYVKKQHIGLIKNLDLFLKEVLNSMNPGSYLAANGLVPLQQEELALVTTRLESALNS